MANVLKDAKKQQILALGRLGWSLRRIEDATGVRRETASAYLRAAGIVVRPSRRPKAATPPTDFSPGNASSSEPKPAIEVEPSTTSNPAITQEPPTDSKAARTETASACEHHREHIELAMAAGRNAMAVYQELVDAHGFVGSYTSVRRFVKKLRGVASPQPRAVIITAAGAEAQVDYGEGPMVRDPATGKYRRTRLFVMTLGCSRKSVRLLTFRSSSRIWAELHERAFRRLGGATRTVVLDNLREGVLTADIYDAAINPLYRDVLRHYGAIALPCRVRDPDRKGKVESGVGHAQKTPLKARRFESLEDAQAHLDRWEERWADTRIHGTTKRQVAAMFAEERAALLSLPIEPFRYYAYGTRTVHLDGHVEVSSAYYSTPPGFIGQVLPVQWDERHVRILHPRTGELLREHIVQSKGRHQTRAEDKPEATPKTTEQLLTRARRAGKHIGAVCSEIHRRDGEPGVRRILGVFSLARKHGVAAVDDACSVAMTAGAPTYRFLRVYLDKRKEPDLRHVDPLIRQLTIYRDLINHKTKEAS
jgi:transposase